MGNFKLHWEVFIVQWIWKWLTALASYCEVNSLSHTQCYTCVHVANDLHHKALVASPNCSFKKEVLLSCNVQKCASQALSVLRSERALLKFLKTTQFYDSLSICDERFCVCMRITCSCIHNFLIIFLPTFSSHSVGQQISAIWLISQLCLF